MRFLLVAVLLAGCAAKEPAVSAPSSPVMQAADAAPKADAAKPDAAPVVVQPVDAGVAPAPVLPSADAAPTLVVVPGTPSVN